MCVVSGVSRFPGRSRHWNRACPRLTMAGVVISKGSGRDREDCGFQRECGWV